MGGLCNFPVSVMLTFFFSCISGDQDAFPPFSIPHFVVTISSDSPTVTPSICLSVHIDIRWYNNLHIYEFSHALFINFLA